MSKDLNFHNHFGESHKGNRQPLDTQTHIERVSNWMAVGFSSFEYKDK